MFDTISLSLGIVPETWFSACVPFDFYDLHFSDIWILLLAFTVKHIKAHCLGLSLLYMVHCMLHFLLKPSHVGLPPFIPHFYHWRPSPLRDKGRQLWKTYQGFILRSTVELIPTDMTLKVYRKTGISQNVHCRSYLIHSFDSLERCWTRKSCCSFANMQTSFKIRDLNMKFSCMSPPPPRIRNICDLTPAGVCVCVFLEWGFSC